MNQENIIAIIEEAGVAADMDKIKQGVSLSDAGIDSLDLANVLLGIEEKYGIKIPDEDIDELQSVAAIEKYLKAKGV